MRKNKGLRKVIYAGLVFAMTMGLCACGRAATGADAALAKEYVYAYEDIALPEMGSDVTISAVKQYDDRVYMVASVFTWDEVTGSSNNEIRLMSMNVDGTDIQTIEIENPTDDASGEETSGEGAVENTATDEVAADKVAADAPAADMSLGDDYYSQAYEYTGYNHFVFGNDGNLYAVKEYQFDDYSDPENAISKHENHVCAWTLDGKLLWQTEVENLQTEEEYSYIRTLIPAENGTVTLLISGDSNSKIEVDAEGNFSEKKQLPNGNSILQSVNDMLVRDDGTLLVTYYNTDWTALNLTTYDVNTDTLGEESQLPDFFMWSGFNSMAVGTTTDIVYSDANGLYGYNIGDEQPTQIMSFINSDLNTTNLHKIVMLDESHFIGFYYDGADYSNRAGIFTKKNAEDIPDKDVIVVAGMYINYEMKNRVVDFNKTNEQYRIVVKEYESYNTTEDYSAGYTQLNNDIISGNMPDILISNASLPMESYISKGLIADVGKLIENDEELSQVEYLENVFSAFSVNDTLYHVVPSFYVRTLVGKTALVSDKESWTMQEFQEFIDSLPEGTNAIGELTRDQFLYMVMQYCGSDFVNVSTGECNFDSQEFINMLEFANTLPVELSEDYYGEDYWMNYDSQYRDNRTVLMEAFISSVRDMNTTMNGYFGEDVNFIGFPASSGKGSVLMDNESFVLSAKSKNLDGAWQFIRYYLTDEYQSSMEWGMPVSKSAFMEKAQDALGKPYYIDESGQKVEYDTYFTINGEDVILEPLSQEQVEQVVDVVLSTAKRGYTNEDIQNIIAEESAAFFEGQKSATEVAQIIQSRAQIFVDENR